MASAQYNYAPYHPIGAANLLVWDALAGPDSAVGGDPQGAWRSVGKVADAAVVMTAQAAGQELALKGLSQPISRRAVAQRYSLSFRLLEEAGPEAHALLFGLGSAQAGAGSDVTSTSEVLRLYGSDWHELAHPFGILAEPAEGVEVLDAMAGGSGGGIPAGTHYYWVVPVVPGEGGAYAWGAPATAGSVSVSSGQKVTITFTPPASYTPAQYIVFHNSSAVLSSAQVATYASGAGGNIVVAAHSNALSYSLGAQPVRLFSYDGATRYAPDTDFAVDTGKGLLRRLPGGAIPGGARVLAVYSYARPAGVLTQLGDCVAPELYRRVKLLQLAPENADGGPGDVDPATWRETGVEWELHRVCVSAADGGYSFTPDDFSPGAAVVWDCMYDSAYARVGVVRSTFGVLAEYQ